MYIANKILKKQPMVLNELQKNYEHIFEKKLIDAIAEIGILKQVPENIKLMEVGQYINAMPLVLEGAIKVLRDDNKGSRHQKFLLKVSSNQTILIAHNIDLAPRINSISKGDTIHFNGEYEWSNKGGVVHWTHHDPNKRHVDGWLKHEGKTYQ